MPMLPLPKILLYLLPLALVAILGGGYIMLARGNNAADTFTVHAGNAAGTIAVSGTVKAAQNVDLGFAQSGRVSTVYTAVGETVHAGALLAEVENGDLRAQVLQRKAALAAAKARLASLEAGTRPETIAVTRSMVVNDNVALIQADQALADAIRAGFTAADSAVHNTLDEFVGSPRSGNPQLLFTVSDSQYEVDFETGRAAAEGALAEWQTDLSLLTSSDAVAHADLAQAKLASITKLVGLGNTALNNANPSSSVSSATIVGWITEVAAARTALDKATSALTSAQTARAAASAALDRDQKTLALQEAGSTQEDIDAELAAVQAADADVQNAQAQLQKTLVTAPFDGLVTKMDAKVGQVVNPGVPEISMESVGVFQIECYVPEVNIASVAVGDAADVTLDAYGSDVDFGAKVIAIDPGRTEMGGVSTYKTTLQFAQPDPRVREGMTANVAITPQIDTAGFSIPAGAVYGRNGKYYVQVMGASGIETREVQTGSPAPLGAARVISGLKEGDVVMLTPDTSK